MKNLFFPQSMIWKAVFIAFLFTGAMFYAQNKVYASQQANEVFGLCLLCSVKYPENAIGSNENDYSSLKIPIGIIARIEQTLTFPVKSNSKVVIGIGTPNSTVSAELLKGVSVETFLDDTSNNDYTIIDFTTLKTGQDPHKGIIEFSPKKRFNRIRITLNSGLLHLNDDFRIYYAYLSEFITECGTPPLHPLYYYSFNGNTQESVSGLDLEGTSPGTYQDNLVCGKALTSNSTNALTFETLSMPIALDRTPKTISFWASVENSGRLRIELPGTEVIITSDSAKSAMHPYPDGDTPLYAFGDNSPGQLNHYAIVYDYEPVGNMQGILCIYKNGVPIPSPYNFYTCIGHSFPHEGAATNIKLLLKKAQIDELLIYDRKLTPEEISSLACSYGKIPNCSIIPPTVNPDKIYANSQANQAIGLCLGCSVQDPLSAVGDNENDYSSLKIPSGVTGKIAQTLIFPAFTTKNFRKIVIGIGTNNLSVQKLNGISIETFLGNTSNNDLTNITSNMLKPGPQLNRGTIEFIPEKHFDRVRIYLNSQGNLKDIIGIFYAYHISGDFATCGIVPLNPLAYYSFDDHINDTISGLNLINETGTPTYESNASCGKKLTADTNIISLKSPQLPIPLSGYNLTLSFLARAEKNSTTSQVHLNALGKDLYIKRDSISFARSQPILDGFNHYTLVYSNDRVCLYVNARLELHNPACTPLADEASNNRLINFFLREAQIDELTVYDRILSEEEIEFLAYSYETNQDSRQSPSAFNNIANMKASPVEYLSITPNPTGGSITLHGNMPLENANIFITNTSGKEVYRTKLTSKTFDLPATLPGGVYILNLQTKDNKAYSRKIILAR